MAAHRYWRINVTANNGDAIANMAELMLYTSLGGTNVAYNGTASASSEQGGSWVAGNLFDANETSSHSFSTPVSFPQWVKYDFGSGNAKDIVAIGLRSSQIGGGAQVYYWKNWDVQYSDDNSSWTTAWSNSNASNWSWPYTHVFNSSGAYAGTTDGNASTHRFWRLKITQRGTDATNCGLSEVEFRTTSGGSDVTAPAAIDAVGTRSWTLNPSFSCDTTTYKFGSGAGRFSGANFEALTHGSTSDFNFGTGDFCVKGWICPLALNNDNAAILSSGETSWQDGCRAIQVRTSGKIAFAANISGGFNQIALSTTSMVRGTWYYFELSRTSGTTKLFMNGTQEVSTSDSTSHSFNGNSITRIGSNWDGSSGRLAALLDDLIIEKGAGHSGHTSNYTPPTAAHSVGSQTVSLLRFDAGNAFASSFESYSSYPAYGAFDNSTGYWSMSAGSTVPEWIGYDFGVGNEKNINEVALTAGTATKAPRQCVVQYSDDGMIWSDKWSFSTTWSTDNSTQVFTAAPSASTRPVVFVCT